MDGQLIMTLFMKYTFYEIMIFFKLNELQNKCPSHFKYEIQFTQSAGKRKILGIQMNVTSLTAHNTIFLPVSTFITLTSENYTGILHS